MLWILYNCGQLYVLILLSLSQGLHFNFVYGLFGLVWFCYPTQVFTSQKNLLKHSLCAENCAQHDEYTYIATTPEAPSCYLSVMTFPER